MVVGSWWPDGRGGPGVPDRRGCPGRPRVLVAGCGGDGGRHTGPGHRGVPGLGCGPGILVVVIVHYVWIHAGMMCSKIPLQALSKILI